MGRAEAHGMETAYPEAGLADDLLWHAHGQDAFVSGEQLGRWCGLHVVRVYRGHREAGSSCGGRELRRCCPNH